MSRKKKGWIITGSIIGGIVVAFGIFLLVWFAGDRYPQWDPIAREEFEIPGLDEGFTPQGLAKIDGKDEFLMSGYMHKESGPSRIYLVTVASSTARSASIEGVKVQAVKHVTLKNSLGLDFMGHMGGIATDGTHVWVASDDRVYYFPLTALYDAPNGGVVAMEGSLTTEVLPAYIFAQGGTVWVGEFYREQNYPTAEAHHMTTPDGTKNKAMICAYRVDEQQKAKLSVVPEKVLSVGGLVQGFAITDEGNIVLSTSYGLPNSNIYIHKNVLAEAAHASYKIDSADVPLWYLDSKTLEHKIVAPSMAEEIDYADGRIYVGYESACKKYALFTRRSVKHVYSFDIDDVISK